MPNLIGQFELPVGPTKRRRAPQLVLRSQRRKQVQKLRAALVNVLNQDLREARRAEALQYQPFLFRGLANSKIHKAINLLVTQCDDSLNAKV
jgi:hypothetical protein